MKKLLVLCSLLLLTGCSEDDTKENHKTVEKEYTIIGITEKYSRSGIYQDITLADDQDITNSFCIRVKKSNFDKRMKAGKTVRLDRSNIKRSHIYAYCD